MAKPFSVKAFNDAVKSGLALPQFTDTHKQLLDVMKEIAAAIEAEGVFTAKVGVRLGAIPELEIVNKQDSYGQLFRISFGHDAFGGTPTIALSVGAERRPIGKAEGYSIQYDTDRDALLKEIGKEVARNRGVQSVTEAAVKHINGVKPQKTAP